MLCGRLVSKGYLSATFHNVIDVGCRTYAYRSLSYYNLTGTRGVPYRSTLQTSQLKNLNQCRTANNVSTLGCIQKRHYSAADFHKALTYYTSPEFAPVGQAQALLECVHSNTGLPWWATIILTTVAVRSLMVFPLMLMGENNGVKLARVEAQLKDVKMELFKEVAIAKKMYNWDDRTAEAAFIRDMKRLQREHWEREGCHPFKIFPLFIVQMPIWFGLSLALRNMSGSVRLGALGNVLCPDLATEGALWFSNMLVPDPLWVFPVVMVIAHLAVTEMFYLRVPKITTFRLMLTWFMRFFSVFLFYVALQAPSAVSLYWCASGSVGLLQNILLLLPSTRRLLKLPIPTTTPFKDLLKQAQQRYALARLLQLGNVSVKKQ